MGKVIALLVVVGLVVGVVNAAEYTPASPRPSTDATWTPADATPVDVQAQADRTIEVAPVYISAKAPRRAVKQTAQCGAFQFRALEQGRGDVRGFCGDGL